MKKIFALILVTVIAFGMLCACGQPTEKESGDAPTTNSAKELISRVHQISSGVNNGEKSGNEYTVDVQWTETGMVMDGYYEESDGSKSEVHMELVLDSEKRPLTMTRTSKDSDGEIDEAVVTFSYPSAYQIKVIRTYSEENIQEYLYEFDENGLLIQEKSDTRTKSYEYDSYGNCTREITKYADEEEATERKTAYTYDETGKITFAVRTYDDETPDDKVIEVEEQLHYYYYPNGNVMYILSVSSKGIVNAEFKPYNTKDIAYGSGKEDAWAPDITTEKEENGYISKVQRGDTTITFAYDDKGNLIKETRSDGYEYQWEYDAQNRPVKYTTNYYVEEYEYDELGRRTSEKVISNYGTGNTETRTFNEEGMSTTIIYTENSKGDTWDSSWETKMEIQYVENSQCSIDEKWAEFFLSNLLDIT